MSTSNKQVKLNKDELQQVIASIYDDKYKKPFNEMLELYKSKIDEWSAGININNIHDDTAMKKYLQQLPKIDDVKYDYGLMIQDLVGNNIVLTKKQLKRYINTFC